MPPSVAHDAPVIRNVILHMNNEQPLLADLFELPGNNDVGLRCTNLRSMNGKRPVFVEEIASIFFFPYLHIRFVEIPPVSAAETGLPMPVPVGSTMFNMAAVATAASQALPPAARIARPACAASG